MEKSEMVLGLKARRKELLRENLSPEIFEKIVEFDGVIATLEGERVESSPPPNRPKTIRPTNQKRSKQERVIDLVIECMDAKGLQQISTSQAVDYFRQKRYFVDEWTDMPTKLGSFLSTEHHKKTGRITSLGKATWAKIREKPAHPHSSLIME